MFEKIATQVKSGSKSKTKASRETPRTSDFLQKLVDHNLRLTYAGLAFAAEALGEHTPSGLSAGQRGAGLVRNLPTNLQPHICRSNGGYKSGTEWPNAEVPSDLSSRDHVGPDTVEPFVQAFIKATSKPVEEVQLEQPEQPQPES